MDKRRNPRFKRRIQLRFWSLEDRTPRKGFTHNISVDGMFIGSSSPFRPGSRIFVEIPSTTENLVLQAEVRYSARVDPLLQKVKPSGMGVRFLSVQELMAEVLKLKRSIAGEEEESTGGEPAEAARDLEGPILQVTFETPRQLANTYERDIKFGGLFVATSEDLAEHDKVILEFSFAWDRFSSVRLQAVVIKKFAAAEGTVAGESVSGVGVAFSNPTDVAIQFDNVLSNLDRAGPST